MRRVKQEEINRIKSIYLALGLLISLNFLPGCTLTVIKAGSGTGTVTSTPSGIACGSACRASFDYGTVVWLNATPDPGSVFVGWIAPCSGVGTCSLTMGGARVMRAAFRAPAVAAGAYHTCTLRPDGSVWCWGRNSDGQLGDGSTQRSPTPVQVVGISTAIAIAAGAFHTCALLSDLEVHCWGHNADGQLGIGSYVTPIAAPRRAIAGAVAIAAGGYHTCAVLWEGTVRCWGLNADYQLGELLNSGRSSNVPLPLPGVSTAVGISAGAHHSCAPLSDGTVRCWGLNTAGQLGNGSTTMIGTTYYYVDGTPPSAVTGLATTATAITAGIGAGFLVGGFHSCALLSNGAVQCWGENAHGALGDGSNQISNVPVTVRNSSAVRAIAAGAYHTCALLGGSNTGHIECWGLNNDGELGNGSNQASNLPVPVATISTAISIAVGGYHSCAVLANNPPDQIKCWGRNADGELGDGSTTPSNRPVSVFSF